VPKLLEGDNRTATEIQQEQLRMPVGKRNINLMISISEAQSDANLINHGIKQAGKAAGLATNNLQGEPIFDADGNLTGFKVR